jgi:hypothetical protein
MVADICTLKRAKNGKIMPLDILVYINDRKDLFSRIKRWAIGPYEHVSIYLGKAWGTPLKYESEGRGVAIKSLASDTGLPVVVMRATLTQEEKDKVFISILDICSNSGSYYDYFAVVKYCLPRIIERKFHFKLPTKYKRDSYMICSEAAAEPFWRNYMRVLRCDTLRRSFFAGNKLLEEINTTPIPMPSDFVNSDSLKYISIGNIFSDLFPWEEK